MENHFSDRQEEFMNFTFTPDTFNCHKPYCCPVCMGKGFVQSGFYQHIGGCGTASDMTPDQCKSCEGKGFILV